MDICFDVTNQTVSRSERNTIVNWSDDYLRLCFNFVSDDWSDCTKFILIFDGEDVYRFALTDNKFIVPEELLTGVKFLFSIYGVNNTYRITTPKVLLRLREAGYSSDVKELDVDEFTHDVVEEVYIAIDGKADLVHTHTESDITDLKDYSEVGHKHTKSDVTDFTHTHTESDITDLGDYSIVGHTHTKSEVTDFAHTHVKSEITDFAHNHDDRYYTESETDTLLNGKSDTGHTHDDRYYKKSEVDSLIYGLNNKLKLTVDKNIIQTGDTIDLRAFVMEDGMPKQGEIVEFYIDEEEE